MMEEQVKEETTVATAGDAVVQETTPVQTQVSQTQESQTQVRDREYNFRVMRERAEQAERRAQELERSIQQQQRPEPEESYDPDSFIEGKTFSKHVSSVKEMRKKQEELEKEIASFKATTSEAQLRMKYNDFDRIVNEESMQRLAAEKPFLFKGLLLNKDVRDFGEAAYDLIKTYVQPTKYEAQDKRIEENKAKPKSSSTISPQPTDSPLARVGDYDRRILSESQKDELYREMMDAKSRA